MLRTLGLPSPISVTRFGLSVARFRRFENRIRLDPKRLAAIDQESLLCR